MKIKNYLAALLAIIFGVSACTAHDSLTGVSQNRDQVKFTVRISRNTAETFFMDCKTGEILTAGSGEPIEINQWISDKLYQHFKEGGSREEQVLEGTRKYSASLLKLFKEMVNEKCAYDPGEGYEKF